MSSKVGITVVLVVLLVFCLISVAVGTFLGWRHYQNKSQVVTATNINTPPPPPPPLPSETTTPTNPPQSGYQPPSFHKETAPAGKTSAISSKSHKASAAKSGSHVGSPSSTASTGSVPTASSTANTPSSAESTSKPSGSETSTSTATPPPEESAPKKPQKVKTPHGQLGLIFESRLDQARLSILVDGNSVVAQSYAASSSAPFRLTKQMKVNEGQHFVKVTVTTPNGKTYEQSWNAMVQRKAVTVWKIQMDRFPKKLKIKHIQ